MTDAYSVDVRVTAPVNPTELEDRVADAIQTLFPGAEVESQGSRVVAETHTVEDFRERLFEQRILDTARKQFEANQTPEGFSFDLKKQAAFNGAVNFAVGNPDELGDIHVRVRVNDPSVEEFVDHVAPPTEEGKPVDLDG